VKTEDGQKTRFFFPAPSGLARIPYTKKRRPLAPISNYQTFGPQICGPIFFQLTSHDDLTVTNKRHANNKVGVSKNGGTPKWMVKIMENPIKMDDLGGKPTIFWKHPSGKTRCVVPHVPLKV